MGSDDKKYVLYLRDPQLGDVPIAPEVVHEITVSEDALTPEAMSLLQPMELEFSIQVKTPKCWRCGTRKRFVKILMSEGCSRNMANDLALYVQRMRGQISYQYVLFEALGLIYVAQANLRKDEEHGTA